MRCNFKDPPGVHAANACRFPGFGRALRLRRLSEVGTPRNSASSIDPGRGEFVGADRFHALAASLGDKQGSYRYALVAEALDQLVGPVHGRHGLMGLFRHISWPRNFSG